MQKRKVRFTVTTNTNMRFLTAVPAELTIEQSLPLLLRRYQRVIVENMGEEHALLRSQSISNLTRKGCLVARDELIGDVFVDNDEIHINLSDHEGVEDAIVREHTKHNKRERLEIKKKEKATAINESQSVQKRVEEQHSEVVLPK